MHADVCLLRGLETEVQVRVVVTSHVVHSEPATTSCRLTTSKTYTVSMQRTTSGGGILQTKKQMSTGGNVSNKPPRERITEAS